MISLNVPSHLSNVKNQPKSMPINKVPNIPKLVIWTENESSKNIDIIDQKQFEQIQTNR